MWWSWWNARLDPCEGLGPTIHSDFEEAGVEQIENGVDSLIERPVGKLNENGLSQLRSLKPHDDVAFDYLRADEVDDFGVVAVFARFLRFGSAAAFWQDGVSFSLGVKGWKLIHQRVETFGRPT